MLQAQSSRIRQISVQATLKLTNTPSTTEPEEIVDARKSLKTTKYITTELETIGHKLYLAQQEESRLLNKLCDTLTGVNIVSNDDKFAIFLNNMGRVYSNLDEVYQLYLINMEDQLLKPIQEFNKTDIKKCQQLKLTLKTRKAEYDLKKKDENKLVKSQSTKKVNLQKVHNAKKQASHKLDELQSIRDNFINAVNTMESDKLELLKSLQQYSDSHSAYTKIQAQNVALQTENYMYWIPPNINNSFGLDSDAEDINDNDETMSKFTDWSTSSIIVKQGWVRKRGRMNRAFKNRWFKLYTNKKLVYLTKDGHDGKLKGHINLSKIIYFSKKSPKMIDIKTKSRLWTLQFETLEDRDEWYNAFMETKDVSIATTADQWHIDRGMPPPPVYDDENIDDDTKYNNHDVVEVKQEQKQEVMEITNILVNEQVTLLVEKKFKVKIDSPRLCEDHELKHEIFSVQLTKDEIISGQYVDQKVILLAPKLYISAVNVIELQNDEFRQELVDKVFANNMLMDDIVQEMATPTVENDEGIVITSDEYLTPQ
eukprot:384787_1